MRSQAEVDAELARLQQIRSRVGQPPASCWNNSTIARLDEMIRALRWVLGDNYSVPSHIMVEGKGGGG